MMDPDRPPMMKIDPDAPGLFAILRGEKGPAWMWAVRGALTIIAFLNIVEILVLIR